MGAQEEQTVAIGAGEVHVWEFHPASQPLGELAALLGPAERDRAARFRFDRDRDRYISAHGQLRRVLARYVGKDPGALEFGVGSGGKPRLRWADIEFSLTHSQEIALCAVSRHAPVGIDVEHIREEVPHLEIARGFFTAAETARIERLEGAAVRQREFFRIWTAKEAFLKGTGQGLARAADSFEVLFDAHGHFAGLSGEPGWSLRELDAPSGFAAALAVYGIVPTVRRMSE